MKWFFLLGIFRANQGTVEWHSEVLCERNITGYNLSIVTLNIPQRDLVTSLGEGEKNKSKV